MFVMTDSQRNANPCDPCLDILPPEEGDEMLQLDLERYRAFQEALKTTKVFKHSPAGNAACCEIKVRKFLRFFFASVCQIISLTS